MRNDKQANRDRGQSLVEIALALPIFIMIMLGLLDLGRAFYIQLALRDAADEGATYAALNPGDEAGIKDRTVDAATTLFTIDEDTVFVDPPANVVAGEPITVRIEHPLTLYTPLVQDMIGGGDELTLTGEATHVIITP